MTEDLVITANTSKELLRKLVSDPVRKAKRDRKNANHRRNEHKRGRKRLLKSIVNFRTAVGWSCSWLPDREINGVTLKMTCMACPEQYDAFIGDEQVGYLRLRHGCFSVECPDCGGEQVYFCDETDGDGRFTDAERERYLTEAVDAIRAWVDRNRKESNNA